MIKLAPITKAHAEGYFDANSAFRGDFDLAIAAVDENGVRHGVIAVNADGDKFALAHISTDGNAQVGSLLYGAAWRTAKALGYKIIEI